MSEVRPGAESARRALRMLFAFDERNHTQTARELATALNIPLPSAHRYVALLRDEALLVEAEPGKYRLSPRVFSLARAVEAAEPLVELADPVMRQLAADTGETVLLVELVSGTAVCVHRIESHKHLRLSYEPGHALPLTHGASARVLMSGLPAGKRRVHLDPISDADFAKANAAIELAGQRGWATSHAEIDEGIWAAAAAIRYGGSVIAALTVVSPLSRTPSAVQKRLIGRVSEAGGGLSETLSERLPGLVTARASS